MVLSGDHWMFTDLQTLLGERLWSTFLLAQPQGRHFEPLSCYLTQESFRLVIPLKKFLLSDEHVSRPIPTLSDRQFVVDKTKLSDTEQKIQRELFWYREELFKCLRCQWREVWRVSLRMSLLANSCSYRLEEQDTGTFLFVSKD